MLVTGCTAPSNPSLGNQAAVGNDVGDAYNGGERKTRLVQPPNSSMPYQSRVSWMLESNYGAPEV